MAAPSDENEGDVIDQNKRPRTDAAQESIHIYIVPGRIQAKRLEILKNCARRNNYTVHANFSFKVSHVLTEFETKEQVLRALKLLQGETTCSALKIFSTQWLIDSVKQKSPIIDDTRLSIYEIKGETKFCAQHTEITGNAITVKDFPAYACQRKTLLNHNNKKLVDALEILVKHADYRDGTAERDSSRSLAFCKAAAVLKCLPFEVISKHHIEKLPDIGEHSMRVIEEILEDGISKEVEEIINSYWYQTMELFTGVYGIGSSTAKQLFNGGLRNIEDIRQQLDQLALRSKDRIWYGLAFYEDLSMALTISEAETLLSFLKAEAAAILPGVGVELAGGFRRGKMTGHDADFLFSHPTQGAETGFLLKLHDKLASKGFILHGRYYKPDTKRQHNLSRPNTMDDFEKCFLICKFPTSGHTIQSLEESNCSPVQASSYHELRKLACQTRTWKSIRVDLIVCPASQHAYALVGWTGNKHFNRSLRHYAKKELNMTLTSHGLWSCSMRTSFPACTERDVFTNLKLNYLEPNERNA